MSKHKIVIMRHGESEEDKDPGVKSAVNDPARLTSFGREQVRQKACELLNEYSGFENFLVYHSGSVRVVETAEIFLSQSDIFAGVGMVIDPSIRNLDWGKTNQFNVREVEAERYRTGVLNFQFPGGDNTPDYVQRIASFCQRLIEQMSQFDNVCTTLFTHGFALRVIVKHLLGMSDDEFRYLSNPKNCFSCILEIDYSSRFPRIKIKTPLPRVEFLID